MSGNFEVYEDADGKFRFRLKDAAGRVVAVGERYLTREGARAGAEFVRSEAPGASVAVLDAADGVFAEAQEALAEAVAALDEEPPRQLVWHVGDRVEVLDDPVSDVWVPGKITHVGPSTATHAGPVFLPEVPESYVRVLTDRTESSPGFTIQAPKGDPLGMRPPACTGGCECRWRSDADRYECGCGGPCSGLGGGPDGQSPDPSWESRPDPADAWHQR